VTSTAVTRPTIAQRLAAIAAIAALLVAVGVVAILALENLGSIIVASVGLALAIVGCWYSLSREGVVRLLALALIVVGTGLVIVTLVVGEVKLWPWVIAGVSSVVSVAAA
jgi:hypothetical protein